MIIHTYKYTYIKLYQKINRESYLSYIVILIYFPRRIYNNYTLYKLPFPLY